MMNRESVKAQLLQSKLDGEWQGKFGVDLLEPWHRLMMEYRSKPPDSLRAIDFNDCALTTIAAMILELHLAQGVEPASDFGKKITQLYLRRIGERMAVLGTSPPKESPKP